MVRSRQVCDGVFRVLWGFHGNHWDFAPFLCHGRVLCVNAMITQRGAVITLSSVFLARSLWHSRAFALAVRWRRSRAGSLQGLLPGAPTDPGVHVKCTRVVTLWNRCPPHDWVVSRGHAGEAQYPRRGSNSPSTTRHPLRSTGSGRAVPPLQHYYGAL